MSFLFDTVTKEREKKRTKERKKNKHLKERNQLLFANAKNIYRERNSKRICQ
jgi:hypothetical protein